MISVRSTIEASDVNNGSTRVLFVEGREDSFDSRVLRRLLDIDIKPVGKSSEIRAASKAFFDIHPGYFFLVDRDHFESEEVEKSWNDFAENKGNLIIWRKKEIENYFLDPEFLIHSRYIDKDRLQDIREILLNHARCQLYLSVVSQVIISVREELKCNWIKIPHNESDYPDESTALEKLLAMSEFSAQDEKTSRILGKANLEKRYHQYLSILLGDASSLEWGKGEWLSLIPGKKILHKIFESRHIFGQIKGKNNQILQGKLRWKAIVDDLMKQNDYLPDDFKRLQSVISNRVLNASNASFENF